MNILRGLVGSLILALGISALAGCADAPSYGAAPVISGVPKGYDARQEEARGR
jgi:hypothetical protein